MIDKTKKQFLRDQVFTQIKTGCGGKFPFGATNDEMQVALRRDSQSLTPRTRELVKAKLVKNSGRTRRTRRGHLAIIWTPGAGVPVDGNPNQRMRSPSAKELLDVQDTLDLLLASVNHLDAAKLKTLRAFMKWVTWISNP